MGKHIKWTGCCASWRDFENRGVNYQNKRMAASASFGNVLEMQFLRIATPETQ